MKRYLGHQHQHGIQQAEKIQHETMQARRGGRSRTVTQCRFGGDVPGPAGSQPTRPNTTGMPDRLKTGLERLSGFDLSPVRVHYNSPKPAQVGALAYAQGTEIHLGRGQERHLPHEGWHMVQQLQGRVAATVQQKSVHLNDNDGLEREADVMGVAALQAGGNMDTAGSETLTPFQSAVAPVVQRRIPEMTLEFIQDNKEMAVEILMHAMRNMDQSEFQELTHPTSYRFDDIVDVLQHGTPETVYELHLLIYEKSGEEKRYHAEIAMKINPSPLQIQLINEQVGSNVLPALAYMYDNTNLHKIIFGPECNSSRIKHVVKAVYDALDMHVKHKTCPLKVIGDRDMEHNKWIGAVGAATFGKAVISIGRNEFNEVLNGSLEGLALLVHEFSHAAAGTEDFAYSMANLAGLTTEKRQKNAETYAQAFQECCSDPNPARYYNQKKIYDPDKITATRKKSSASNANLRQRLAGINELMNLLWNLVANAYSAARLLEYDEDIPSNAKDLMAYSVLAAIYPYWSDHLDTTMALIEDRAKVLSRFMRQSTMKEALKAKGVQKEDLEAEINDDGEYTRLAAIAMADHFGLSIEVTEEFLNEALRINEYNLEAVRIETEYRSEIARPHRLRRADSAAIA